MAQILHIVNSFFAVPYFIGGQFKYFKEQGHNIHLICPESEFIESYSRKMEFSFTIIEITRTYTPIKDIKAIIGISKYIRRNKVDILVGHTPKGAFLAMIAGRINKVPKRIYFRHGLVYETAGGLTRRILMIAEKLTSSLSTHIICVSHSVYELSIKDKLNPISKQSVLGRGTCGGIDTQIKFNPYVINQKNVSLLKEHYCINVDDVVLGFCGRLVQDKGIGELVEALDLIKSRNTGRKFVLLLVGVLEKRDNLSAGILDKIKKDKDIIFTGYVSGNLQEYYALMDIYILPSYREGFPLSVLEASAMEIPVLTSRATGCIDSIVENVTGKYIENTSISIAEGVEFFLNNPDMATLFGKNGREFVTNNFDNLILWKELEQFYT